LERGVFSGGEMNQSGFLGRVLMKSVTWVAAAVVLAGCAENSGVVQMGSDTYMVSRQAATGFTGLGTLKADAMREAYAQCQKTGKSVQVVDTVDSKPPYIFGNFPSTEIHFKCVAE
jgi:hypothetical protein